MEAIPLLTTSTSKLPQEKKILPFCFVGSGQCNSISHLSFNLLFIVAEPSERYHPEFPFSGCSSRLPLKQAAFSSLSNCTYSKDKMGASVFQSRVTFQSRSRSNYLLALQALPLGKPVSILCVIQFCFTVAANICSLPAELEEWKTIVL